MTEEDRPAPTIKHSRTFPPGYGDFTLLSCDNTLFSFPRGILAHVSPVFKDMFELGAQASEAHPGQEHELLQLPENGKILNLLLRHIDPVKEAPEMLKSTVANLVKAAHKYQIKIIITRFQNTVNPKTVIPCDKNSAHNLISVDPLLVLSLALYAGLDRLSKLALEKVMASKVTVSEILNAEINLPLKNEIIVMRREREDSYTREINMLREEVLKKGPIKCPRCQLKFNDWCFLILTKTRQVPNWASVESTKDFLQTICEQCGLHGSLFHFMTTKEWKKWKDHALEHEKSLPKIQ